eukprot:CAMPEP_0206203632 /NCGR_PEP_ID=MMETSP0166-20121206/12972_1 /ASSEMBLY_ACC=CAM_ASM_000260 /TAXON_ID=95228 /ORGANISM="Vannella robusta, Strain DIVA3 518/3/11/1/6" /LENGTH=199 /DNA_ID=CAMNT_0053622961 /DNA_START=818 /DNA_END=1413 /DNA_ORIENTATION=+
MKVVVVGDSGVGKSNLILRFTQDNYCFAKEQTIGLELTSKNLCVNKKTVQLEIADTAGQERYRTLTSSHYRYVDGVILVYDITDRNSFESLSWWIGEVKNCAPANVQIVLVAHKTDAVEQRVITKEEGESFADQHKLSYFEASAKTNHNVDVLFEHTVSQALENQMIIMESVSTRRSRCRPRKKTNSEKFLHNIRSIIS